MKSIILFIVTLLLAMSIINGCSDNGQNSAESINTFEGYFVSVVGDNELKIECSKAAKRNTDSTTEEGYDCNVETTEKTTIKTEGGKSLEVDELRKLDIHNLDKPKKAKVILSEEKNINLSKSSRKGLDASEIIIFH
ncbi:hypothetical protein GCM10010954_29850 [Halobacillus andaensis]|uniref:Lipoprotein n=1 Tax=Halobacillus andaensis TaxID=1176239 RepID=A0A917B7T6_HALAA|nr:hypothetical protein [Halobacillus andaensis]MBP2005088.1 hypothetical protein [Halobacillus andaensis]GGF28802.1 hypothetical protein GCM10010954_29850 [Halobacillus andaensis]